MDFGRPVENDKSLRGMISAGIGRRMEELGKSESSARASIVSLEVEEADPNYELKEEDRKDLKKGLFASLIGDSANSSIR